MHAAAIPDELVELSAELEALGGGDTRVGEATVFCRVRPVERASEALVVTVGSSGSHMLVRDPRTSDATPAAHAVRRFRISPGGAIGGAAALAAPVGRGATQSDVAASVGREALEWWLAGFNASVIAHGQTGAGKTYSLYGPAAAVYAESVPPDAMGLVPRLLGRVYEARRRDALASRHARLYLHPHPPPHSLRPEPQEHQPPPPAASVATAEPVPPSPAPRPASPASSRRLRRQRRARTARLASRSASPVSRCATPASSTSSRPSSAAAAAAAEEEEEEGAQPTTLWR